MNFDHRHVISLKGVCIDGGPVPYVILPHMANGSLLKYLKNERNNLVTVKDAGADIGTESDVSCRKLVLWYPLWMLNESIWHLQNRTQC